jgi:glycogen debranching enzyme
MTVSSQGDAIRPDREDFLRALKGSKRAARRAIREFKPIFTSNASFEAWLQRAAADLSLLVTELDTGPYPYAGIPWFSAPFGAMRCSLPCGCRVEPSLARGVLACLSAHCRLASARRFMIQSQAKLCMS